MRIDVAVASILKQTQTRYRVGAYTQERADELADDFRVIQAKEWVTAIWQDLLKDPIIDTIASNYGLESEYLIDNLGLLEIMVFEGNEGSMVSGGFGSATRSGSGEEITALQISVPMSYYFENDTSSVITTMIHEITHLADDLAQTVGEGGLTGGTIEYFENPQEQEAFKSQMLDLLRLGYTGEQVKAYIYEDILSRKSFDMTAEMDRRVQDLIDKMLYEIKWENPEYV